MKRLSIALSVALAFAVMPAIGQEPAEKEAKLDFGISPGELAPTPEMWFYQQYRRQYENPATAVRQKAEFKARQRQYRLASLKWFGLSNARPQAGVDPFHGEWSPRWTSNNFAYPFRWTGVGRPWIFVTHQHGGLRLY